MPDWTSAAMIAILTGLPATWILLERRAARRRAEIPAGTQWPPHDPGWTEAHGPGRGRAFQYYETHHITDTDYPPPAV